jgi:hypothetical protein
MIASKVFKMNALLAWAKMTGMLGITVNQPSNLAPKYHVDAVMRLLAMNVASYRKLSLKGCTKEKKDYVNCPEVTEAKK